MRQSKTHLQKSTIGRTHPIQVINRGLSVVAPGLAAMAAEQLFVTGGLGHRRILRDLRVVARATDFIIQSGWSSETVRHSRINAASAA